MPRLPLYSVDLWIQTYMELVLLKYAELATNYPWIYEYLYSVAPPTRVPIKNLLLLSQT